MNQIIDMIKQNKKIAIALAVVLVLLLIFFIIRNEGGGTNGYFDTIEELNAEEHYNGTITINTGSKDIKLDVLKNGSNYVISASVPNSDLSYNDLIVKQDGVIYLNSGIMVSNGGLIAVREAQQEESVRLLPTLIEALKKAEITTDVDEEGFATLSVNSTEEWTAFFNAINSVLTENIDSISGGYSEKEAVKALLNDAAKNAKAAAETSTVANAVSASIKAESVDNVKKYTGTFEFTADFSVLPDFVNPEDFDSNQFKITGEINITVGAASTAKPVGAVYDANPQSLTQFFATLWDSIFGKEAYTALNEVTVTSTEVYNKYNLGEVIEESRFKFNKEGLESAEWIISSTNQDIITAYANKYTENEKPIFDESSGVYKLVLFSSENGLLSLNKLGTTPKAFGEYLKTAKGGEIIV